MPRKLPFDVDEIAYEAGRRLQEGDHIAGQVLQQIAAGVAPAVLARIHATDGEYLFAFLADCAARLLEQADEFGQGFEAPE